MFSRKLPLLALLAAPFAVACSGSAFTTGSGSPAATPAATTTALDSANGGLDVSESATTNFGDSEVADLPMLDDSAVASVDPTDQTTAAALQPGAAAYRIAMVWGHLPPPHDADTTDVAAVAEDWNGSVSVAAGAIGLKRTLSFDANDHIDRPRTNAQTLSFASHTLPYVDGLLVRVVVPSGGSPTLHFATSALTTDIDLSQLAAGVGGVQRLASEDSEGLAWVGFPEDGCTRGFIHGRWVKDAAALGRMMAVVSDGDGSRIGDLRGLWGHAPRRDADVWFAKYIGVAGDAHGLAFGKYGSGTFDGLWGAKSESNTVDVGTTEGFYSDAYDTDGRGVIVGRWSDKCSQ